MMRSWLTFPLPPTFLLYITIGALDGHTDGVYCSALSKQSLVQFLTGACDGEVRVWDMNVRKCVSRAYAHSGFVRGLSVAPDGGTFFSCGDKTVKQWKLCVAGDTSEVRDAHSALHLRKSPAYIHELFLPPTSITGTLGTEHLAAHRKPYFYRPPLAGHPLRHRRRLPRPSLGPCPFQPHPILLLGLRCHFMCAIQSRRAFPAGQYWVRSSRDPL